MTVAATADVPEAHYGRKTLVDASDKLATVALTLGYPIQLHQAPTGDFLYELPADRVTRDLLGCVRAWSFDLAPVERVGFARARDRLERVQRAMRLAGAQTQLIIP